jgi:hypothetical protein
LKKRGVQIKIDNIKIVGYLKGFDFLGFNLREYQDLTRVKRKKKEILIFKSSKNNLF